MQGSLGTCIDFSGERNEVVYEALQFPSLTYVWREWERYGAVNRIVASDDGRTIPTERICRRDNGEDGDCRHLPRVLRLGRAGGH